MQDKTKFQGFDATDATTETLARVAHIAAAGGRVGFWPGACPLAGKCPRLLALQDLKTKDQA